MNVLERVAFAWVLTWVLLEVFVSNLSYHERLKTSLIVAGSIAYLYGLHVIIYQKIKSLVVKKKAE